MIGDALLILLYVALIVFIIVLIVLCIKLIGTLCKADKLIDNITKKAESLDGVFDMIDYTTNKFGMITDSIFSYIGGVFKKFLSKKNNEERNEE